MSDAPVRYAKSGDVHIAYRTLGDGPNDLVFVGGSFTNLDALWRSPSPALLRELGRLLPQFEDRGARELKGIPGEWRLYSVTQS